VIEKQRKRPKGSMGNTKHIQQKSGFKRESRLIGWVGSTLHKGDALQRNGSIVKIVMHHDSNLLAINGGYITMSKNWAKSLM